MPIVIHSLEELDRLLKKIVNRIDKALLNADLATSKAIDYNAKVIELMANTATIPQVYDSLREIAMTGEVLYVIRTVPQVTQYLPTVPRTVTRASEETRKTLCRTIGISLEITKPCSNEEIAEAIRVGTEATKAKVGLQVPVEALGEMIPAKVRRAIGKELLLINRALVRLEEAYIIARDVYTITSNIDVSYLPPNEVETARRRVKEVRDAYTILPASIAMLRTALKVMLEAYVKVAIRLGITSKNLLDVMLGMGKG